MFSQGRIGFNSSHFESVNRLFIASINYLPQHYSCIRFWADKFQRQELWLRLLERATTMHFFRIDNASAAHKYATHSSIRICCLSAKEFNICRLPTTDYRLPISLRTCFL